MEVYVDGDKMDVCVSCLPYDMHIPGTSHIQGEFTDSGTETHFALASHAAYIRATSSGNKRRGLVYCLVIGGTELEPISEVTT